jgi:hypothetical protein
MTVPQKSKSAQRKLMLLTAFNLALFLPWYALRLAHDAGEDYPVILIILAGLTISTWWQLLSELVRRLGVSASDFDQDRSKHDE